jgi:aminopeptidase-like protein
LDFIRPHQLAGSLSVCAGIIDVIENNRRYYNQKPFCEPQLGRRNLYRATGGEAVRNEISAQLWVLNLSDGKHSLLDIAERSGLPFEDVNEAAELLVKAGLLSTPERDGETATLVP